MAPDRLAQPCREALRLPAFVQPLPDPKHRVLAHVLRQVRVTYHAAGHGERRSGVPFDEQTEGPVVAGPRAGKQGRIGAGIGLRRRFLSFRGRFGGKGERSGVG
jgi:hypothetical protein